MSRGACRGEDPEIFFPIAGTGPALGQISAAKAICGRCSVRQPCLSYAVTSLQDGIWGGMTAEERRVNRWAQADSRGTPAGLAQPAEPAGRASSKAM
jgi:WhiB family redox-sensing transcriptional regulator